MSKSCQKSCQKSTQKVVKKVALSRLLKNKKKVNRPENKNCWNGNKKKKKKIIGIP
jgi:hypothetical protein